MNKAIVIAECSAGHEYCYDQEKSPRCPFCLQIENVNLKDSLAESEKQFQSKVAEIARLLDEIDHLKLEKKPAKPPEPPLPVTGIKWELVFDHFARHDPCRLSDDEISLLRNALYSALWHKEAQKHAAAYLPVVRNPDSSSEEREKCFQAEQEAGKNSIAWFRRIGAE